MSDVFLKMAGIQKSFPGVHALDDVHLEVRSGEVMALVGDKRSGKVHADESADRYLSKRRRTDMD